MQKIATCYMQRRSSRVWYHAAALEWGGERDQTHRANQRVGTGRGMQHIHTWTYPQNSKPAITRQYKTQPKHNWCTHFANCELYNPQCTLHTAHSAFKSRGSKDCTGSVWSMLKLQSLNPTIFLAHKKLTHYTNTQKCLLYIISNKKPKLNKPIQSYKPVEPLVWEMWHILICRWRNSWRPYMEAAKS